MPPVKIHHPRGRSSLVVLCAHAAHAIPECFGDLGLSARDARSHIGWDIGSAALARRLCARLDATLVCATVSRLVIDLNRPLDAPDLIPRSSGGIAIPGNIALDEEARACRVREIFLPFHQAVADILDDRVRRGSPTFLLDLHSFAAHWPGESRPWHCGIAHNGCDAFSLALLDQLRSQTDLLVGENKPYGLDGSEYAIPVHGVSRQLPSALLEVRQDQIETRAGQRAWADRLETTLLKAMRVTNAAPRR